MFAAIKDSLKLEIAVEKEIQVTALIARPELFSARVIAKSVSNVLHYYLKSVDERNKEEVAKEYMRQKGWNIE